jgi:hypothetical protein
LYSSSSIWGNAEGGIIAVIWQVSLNVPVERDDGELTKRLGKFSLMLGKPAPQIGYQLLGIG